jgi:hypothetical protein
MTEDIILAMLLFGIVGVCGIISLTSHRKEKTEDHIV